MNYIRITARFKTQIFFLSSTQNKVQIQLEIFKCLYHLNIIYRFLYYNSLLSVNNFIRLSINECVCTIIITHKLHFLGEHNLVNRVSPRPLCCTLDMVEDNLGT